MKKAFTLIELVVAISLLALIFLFASMIFRVSIDSYRISIANAEIMQKFRTITAQLNSDFRGIRKDAPLLIWFEKDPADPSQRFDQIMFFANGDFQSIQLYDIPPGEPDPAGDKPVFGSVARIFYGQANAGSGLPSEDPINLPEEDRLLARRQHILTADHDLLQWHGSYLRDFDYYGNERYEYDWFSLAQWKLIIESIYRNKIIPNCFDFRPLVDMTDPNTFHKLMCQGLGSFSIQWAYWDAGNDLKWFPEVPDFSGANKFGIYFNISPPGGPISKWYEGIAAGHDYPKALKFTFRLYDSKGIIKQDGTPGREFTHIVYLDN